MSGEQVTELVEIGLAVPFPDFIKQFKSDLEPILLAQPGLKSVWTGEVIYDSELESPSKAISLTLWESMEGHAQFLASPSAGPFFDTIKPLTTGPPRVMHFRVSFRDKTSSNDAKTAIRVHNARQTDSRSGKPSQGRCVEDEQMVIEFGQTPHHREPQTSMEESQTQHSTHDMIVVWYSKGTSPGSKL